MNRAAVYIYPFFKQTFFWTNDQNTRVRVFNHVKYFVKLFVENLVTKLSINGQYIWKKYLIRVIVRQILSKMYTEVYIENTKVCT